MLDKDIVNKINSSPFKAFLSVTGGGTSFLGDFLKISGGSKTILGFYTPYDKILLQEFIGFTPEHWSSPETARKMATRAYSEAIKLTSKETAIGIGVTCSLATD